MKHAHNLTEARHIRYRAPGTHLRLDGELHPIRREQYSTGEDLHTVDVMRTEAARARCDEDTWEA